MRSLCLQSKPEDLAEEFEIDRASVKETVAEPLPPDYNVAPTKQVYAVLEPRPEESRASCASRALGAGAVLGEGPEDRQPDDQRPRWRRVAEKPAFRQAFAKRRCLLPADGYFEWYPPSRRPRRASR